MYTGQSSFFNNTAMISKPNSEVTKTKVVNKLKDKKLGKHAKLETLIKYISQLMKNNVAQGSMKEAKLLLSQFMLEFGGDKERFLLWVRFLDIAHVHKINKDGSEEELFKKEIEEILNNAFSSGQQSKNPDWRIARKMRSLEGTFSFQYNMKQVDQVEEDILGCLKDEIHIALEYLLWQEKSVLVDLAKKNLNSLLQLYERPNGKKNLLEAVLSGRFDKTKFDITNSLILGEDGGFYLLLNRLTSTQQEALISQQIVTSDYLEDKVKVKDQVKGDKVVLGTGGFGTVRFAMSLLRSRSLPAEIVCIKKTKDFLKLRGSLKPSPFEEITLSTLEDYFTNDRAEAIYSPCTFDMGLVISKNVIKKDGKDHRKGYLMMEMLPKNTATKIFSQEQYQKWEYQKPYLMDVLNNTQELLTLDIAMTDLKPDNTLYDTDTRKATIIDLGGSVKVADREDIEKFDLTKYSSFQATRGFKAPELDRNQGVINMHKSLAYSCGKVMEEVTKKSNYSNQDEISALVNELTASDPKVRIGIPEALQKLKQMGDDSYKESIIFSHYISKVKDRLEHKKSAISINENIEKTKKLFIPLNATPLDPLKYNNQKTEDLSKKIDDFFNPENTKQVMAIFGVAGSGKSVLLQLKFIEAVNSWHPGKPLPIYFNLANGIHLRQIVKTLNIELSTNLRLELLDRQHLYIDSFDEGLGIEAKRETLIKEYFRKLGSPKIIITCRTDYLQEGWHNWFSPKSNELDVCYVAPINHNGYQDMTSMTQKYVDYSQQHTSMENTTQEYLKRLKDLQLIKIIDTRFMFFLALEVLFTLDDKKERRINKLDIYESYIQLYQNNEIAKLNQEQIERALEMLNFSKNNKQSSLTLTSCVTELGKYLASQMHLRGIARLDSSNKIFTALGFDSSVLLKHQNIIHVLKLLPLKIITHSGKKITSNQVKIGFMHETIKNYYLLEAIKSEIEKEGKSLILATKSIIDDFELAKLIASALQDDTKLRDAFLKAIDNTKTDKSKSSIIYGSNCISLLVAAKYSFSGCDLSNISVKHANLVHGIFHNANLNGADLSGADMSNVNLTEASLDGAIMKGVKFFDLLSADLEGHTGRIRDVSFSPDGKLLASGSNDSTIKIWNPITGECLQTLNEHTDPVTSVSFSPDGKFLASGSHDKTIKIWNLTTSECLRILNGHTRIIRGVSFSPDGKSLASCSNDKTIKIWNSETGDCLQTLDEHTSEVNCISFSLDGKFLASGARNKTIKIWDATTCKYLQTLNGEKGHYFDINSVCFSPDGKFLASGSLDWTVKIWNPTTGECLHDLIGHNTSVASVNFSPDGKFLASGARDGIIKIWNPTTGECLQTLNEHIYSINSISFSPDSKFLASGSNTIKILNPSIKECLQTLNGHSERINSVSFSTCGKFLASGSQDKTIKIWNPTTGECFQTLEGHDYHVNSISFSPDGKFLASCSKDTRIKIWDPTTGKCLQTLEGHNCHINSVSFSPDGTFLASGSEDKTIKIWDSTTGECLQILKGHNYHVNSVSFSPDGKFLASGSEDKTIKVWNSSTHEYLQTLTGHTSYVSSVSFSSAGEFIASSSGDKTIKIWDPTTGKCLQTLEGHNFGVNTVSFSPDDKFLVSGSQDQTIKIWNMITGECLQTFNGHTDSITSASFSPDGKFFASGSFDQTMKVFELRGDKWLLNNNITTTLLPLHANFLNLNNTIISYNNRRLLYRKGAKETNESFGSDNNDNQIDQIEVCIDGTSESIRIADQLSNTFFSLKKSKSLQANPNNLNRDNSRSDNIINSQTAADQSQDFSKKTVSFSTNQGNPDNPSSPDNTTISQIADQSQDFSKKTTSLPSNPDASTPNQRHKDFWMLSIPVLCVLLISWILSQLVKGIIF